MKYTNKHNVPVDKYHVDEFDDLLIQIINHMKEQKETRQEEEDQVHQ